MKRLFTVLAVLLVAAGVAYAAWTPCAPPAATGQAIPYGIDGQPTVGSVEDWSLVFATNPPALRWKQRVLMPVGTDGSQYSNAYANPLVGPMIEVQFFQDDEDPPGTWMIENVHWPTTPPTGATFIYKITTN